MKSFVDETQIQVQGGGGGDGCVSFASTRSAPKQGADGGHGGRGGDVWLVASARWNTLRHLHRGGGYRAENGKNGGGQKKKGGAGGSLYLSVPLGTEVFADGRRLGVLNVEGERLRVAEGGRGGLGNIAFLSSTRQRPRFAQPGKPGESRGLQLHLRILANIGLAGYPNAGKSTLLRALSAARPSVGAYPFTTLTPQLGVMMASGNHSAPVTIADIPGLAPGAHRGRGLGHDFLRHLERTSCIALVVAAQPPALFREHLRGLCSELDAYGGAGGDLQPYPLRKKRRLLIISQMDSLTAEQRRALEADLQQNPLPLSWIMVSAHRGEGLEELKEKLRHKGVHHRGGGSQDSTTATASAEEVVEQLLNDLLREKSHVRVRVFPAPQLASTAQESRSE